MNSVADVWDQVLTILGKKLTSVAITTWFDDCRAVALQDQLLVVHTPSKFKKEIIETRFSDALRSALQELFAGDFDVKLIGDAELAAFTDAENQRAAGAENEEYTFARFVVGNSNKFAHAAALAVAEEQTNKFNPLFIYGESGLGKTHLLHAIRHEILRKHPDYNIVYVKGDDFTNELITAIQVGKNLEFREKYRNADLFLMDDVQFIAGKTSTQEEFFHTFNTLYESNRQIVFTSDRPPNEIMRLADRLKTRFESGLVADIQPPDFETRVAIVRNKSQQLGLLLSDEVTAYVAEQLTSNVRQLEGAVNKMKATRDLMNMEITVPIAEQCIKDIIVGPRAITPDTIIEETAKYYSLSAEDLKSQSRTRNTAMARHVAIYLIRKLTQSTLTDIGEIFGGRDHTTILSSVNRIEDALKDKAFAQTVRDITANINSRG